MPARPATGPTPARSATGATPGTSRHRAHPARPATGPTPTVGVTASRPPAGQSGMRPGPGTGPSPAWQGQAATARVRGPAASRSPRRGPRSSRMASSRAAARPRRQQDRGDWGERTERIERVNASGYPDQRPGGRGPGGPAGRRRAIRCARARPGRQRQMADAGQAPADGARPTGATQTGASRPARRRPARGPATDRREGDRDSGGWPVPARGAAPAWNGTDDDPLTSQAYSRSALGETDGRSYRVAARRSQAQTMLTEQAETFITGQYQSGQYQTGQYQSGQYQSGQHQSGQHQSGHTGDYPTAAFQPTEQRTGEYRQYRDDAPATAGQPAAGRHPGYGGQDGRPATGQPAQPPRAIGGPAGSGATPGLPAGPRSPAGARRAVRRAAAATAAAAPAGAVPAVGAASGDASFRAGPLRQRPGHRVLPRRAARRQGPGQGRPQPVRRGDHRLLSLSGPGLPRRPARPGAVRAHAGRARAAGADDPYYRPLPADGYPSGGGDQDRNDPARAGYGASYGNGYQDPRDRRY